MDLEEGVGENSTPERNSGDFGAYHVRNEVYRRLVDSRNEETISNPKFREQLDAHFDRLPVRYSYTVDIHIDRAEDVLLHQKVLAMARDPENRPAFHIRLLENYWDISDVLSGLSHANLNANTDSEGTSQPRVRQGVSKERIHEVIFSTIDKRNLLNQLSSLLSELGLNIREAHVFRTTDKYSLEIFVVDGWPIEDTESLNEAMKKAIARNQGPWILAEKLMAAEETYEDWQLDRKLINIGDKIASGSFAFQYRGFYMGQDVAVKVLRPEYYNNTLEDEFKQEVSILRQVQHGNVVPFIGACTKYPHFWIVTEYMAGGSLYEFLHQDNFVLNLSQLLRFAIDICKGMEYLHQKDIIHRDLKTANLLLDSSEVVKITDFGLARFQHVGGVMTAETGTYRWMAPEVLNHEPYDQKADVYSFAIILWELLTTKVPYEDLNPIQAALGVREGRRPELPRDAHPKLLDLMQRCWEEIPTNRPSFSQIRVELEGLQLEIRYK